MAAHLLEDMQGALHALQVELEEHMWSTEDDPKHSELWNKQANSKSFSCRVTYPTSRLIWATVCTSISCYLEVLEQHQKKIQDDIDGGADQRTPSLPGCSLLEKTPVEIQKMIMKYVLDFNTAPASESMEKANDFDCFGLTIGYKNQTYILFMPLETVIARWGLGEATCKFVNVRSFYATLQISRTLLAPTSEAMLGSSTTKLAATDDKVDKKVASCTNVGHRTRFWDNDFFFPNGSKDVVHFLNANCNRPTYIEHFAMKNDCWPKACKDRKYDQPEDFFATLNTLLSVKER
ncbi:hypothetical protein LTR15_001685 [Elasticomyces elasticus]|nr:hypothetical protein LTR15_001685 [Elasticomyces elasticus]